MNWSNSSSEITAVLQFYMEIKVRANESSLSSSLRAKQRIYLLLQTLLQEDFTSTMSCISSTTTFRTKSKTMFIELAGLVELVQLEQLIRFSQRRTLCLLQTWPVTRENYPSPQEGDTFHEFTTRENYPSPSP